jgi:hypothetical protein
MKTNQRDAVYNAVVAVIGEVNGKVDLSKTQKAEVHSRLFSEFKAGNVEHSNLPDDEKLTKYIPGLVNNWVRKDPRLNGGTKYTAKNPGIRAGSGDESIKVMKQLLAMTPDASAKAEIQAAIDARVRELKPKKVLNIEALPVSLRHLAQQ